jgi:hypothetical protein
MAIFKHKMLRKRKAGRVAAESYADPTFLEARAMKEAIRDLESYEYVFYTSKARPHVKGTNQYEFEFPGSWRTKTGKECIFGVRSLYIKKAVRNLCFSQLCVVGDLSQTPIYYTYTCMPNDTIRDIVSYLNDTWYNAKDNDFADIFYWNYHSVKKCIQLQCVDLNFPDDVNFAADPTSLNDNNVFDVRSEDTPDTSGGLVLRPVIHINWNREPLLITADFVQQTDNQHLGYTGCEFYPIKKYEIAKNTPYFTIKLWEDGTMNPVELPEDNKDIVVIEAIIERLNP